jgi:hypothetical protein
MTAVDRHTDGARLRAILTLVAALAFVGLSYAAPDFRGYTTDQLPFAEPRPAVQPAGYAFAIWGVIYAWLVVSAGFGLARRAEDADWTAFRWPLILSMGLGAGWLYVAVRDAALATLMIWAMLALALWALARAPRRDAWLARVPIGLYAGWLTAASFVSLGVWLAGAGILPSSRVAALAFVPAAAAVAALVTWRLAPVGGFAFAAAWGLVAIAVQNWGRNTDIVAIAALAVVALAALWWITRPPASSPREST